jgi:chromosome segregation ATPase
LTLSQEASGLVGQYKSIIRDQDVKLNQMKQNLQEVERAKDSLQQQLQEAITTNSQLSDQNILLKAQLQASSELAEQLQQTHHSQQNSTSDHLANNFSTFSISSQLEAKISFYENENTRLLADNSQLRYCLNDAEMRVNANSIEMEKMRKDQEDLLELLADQDTKMSEYRRRLRDLGQQVEMSDDEDDDEATAGSAANEQNGGNTI